MTTAELISLTRRRGGIESTGVQSDTRIADELTLALREIAAQLSLEQGMRWIDWRDLLLTERETPIPAVVPNIRSIEDRTDVAAENQGPEILLFDAIEAMRSPRLCAYTIGAPPSWRLGLKGMGWEGRTLRLYFETDVSAFDVNAPLFVTPLLPPLHHPALALVAAMRMQAQRDGAASQQLVIEAEQAKFKAKMALALPRTFRRN